MNIYETKERIEKFLEKEISHLVPQHVADLFNEILDKVEGKPNGNESTTNDAEPITVDEPITESIESVPTSTDGAATTSESESTPK